MTPKLNINELPEAGDRFVLEDCLGTGVCGKVFSAIDNTSNRKCAIKIQRYNKDNIPYIQEEYRVLKEFADHPNIPNFYGAFRKDDTKEVYFALEWCEGGTIIDFVNKLLNQNRRISEEHIAFVLKEVVKVLSHMHQSRVIHRDVKAKNILLTKEGEVKLADFGLCRHLSSTFGKSDSCIGSPCWMAPEMVISNPDDEESGYGNRIDVWALGITAIELAEGKAPYQEMHPTRAMFQIVRNPPPTLYRPSNWSETYNDFINECLVKNPEHRPYIMELMEHPFLAEVPENNYHLMQELKTIMQQFTESTNNISIETFVKTNLYKKSGDDKLQRMYVEDLAALDKVTEDTILQELEARLKLGEFQTFVGDILVILNPNEKQDIYDDKHHKKYAMKSRSDNAPHIYAVADSAYQDALHHIIPQNIVLGGESSAGKTTNYLHLLDHLLYLGKNDNINSGRIKEAVKLIHAFSHASTPLNDYSTRCVLKTELTFGSSGKVTGAIFNLHQLEKWRVSTIDMGQSNYHILYYFYDGIENNNELSKYHLSPGRNYRYLRIPDADHAKKLRPRDNPSQNIKKFDKLQNIFKIFEINAQQVEMLNQVLAAILNIGDIRFRQESENNAEIENVEMSNRVAALLEIDDKKLIWALTNYCFIKHGTAVRRRHNCDEARDARDVLANTIYSRLVDYVVNVINNKLSYGRAIFGEKYSVRILDSFGFECFKENHLTQLFINCFNEQMHYHFLQRVFAWEALEMNEEDVPYTPFHFYDNKVTLDQILGKPDGVLTIVDDASRMGHNGDYIIDYLKSPERDNVKVINDHDFTISHYTGTITYNAKEMPDRNRDFLPPEVIETLRLSKNKLIKALFANKLTRTGNLYTSFDDDTAVNKSRFKFGGSSSSEEDKSGKQIESFSQIKKMRTTVATFRSLCLDTLKELSVGGGAGGTYFVRCIRSDLDCEPRGFHKEIVKQQLRAMAIVDSTRARQKGFPHRISFSEFLRRYKFLAFDFDENVEVSRDNCRLLLVRLKMEGWMIGKSKVFLKYYNEEYLARLYETQVKKIIKIQSMMRGFLAKLAMKKKANGTQRRPLTAEDVEEDKAARVLQKAYRGVASRKAYGPLVNNQSDNLDANTCKFIRFYCMKWKAKTIFQVLLQYRAARYQDLFNLSQQIHFYNQGVFFQLQDIRNGVDLSLVNRMAQPNAWLGECRQTVFKLPFRLDEIPFYDTTYMCDPLANINNVMEKDEEWDSPLKWRNTVSSQITSSLLQDDKKINISKPFSQHTKSQSTLHQTPVNEHLINLPYNRDPNLPIRRLSSLAPSPPDYPESRITPTSYREPKLVEHKTFHTSSPNLSPRVNYTNNLKPVNKESKYIKSPTNQDQQPNPIAELKNLGKTDNRNEDDPPFNFQAMLRKTNTNRSSLKRTVEGIRTFSIKKKQNMSFDNDRNGDDKKFALRKHKSLGYLDDDNQKMQIVPGIFIEGGVVTDL